MVYIRISHEVDFNDHNDELQGSGVDDTSPIVIEERRLKVCTILCILVLQMYMYLIPM